MPSPTPNLNPNQPQVISTSLAAATAGYSDKEIETLIQRRHPDFQKWIEHWKFCRLAYEGGREWFNQKNLFKFYREGLREYEERVKRSYRANHTKRVVEAVNQFLFKSKPQRAADAPAILRDFWGRATLSGMTMDSFAKQIDIWLSVFGLVYAVVDRPGDAMVAADGKLVAGDAEALPYSYLVFPTHVLDLAFDDAGHLRWILVAEDYRDDADPLKSSGKPLVRYRLWTRSEWILFGPEDADHPEKITRLDSGEHGLGVVPVVPITETEGARYSAPSLIGDVAYLDRTVTNYACLLDEIIYEQTFSQLVMPAEGILPGTDPANQIIAAAKERIFLFSGGDGNNRPSYISPDASQAQLIIDAIDRLTRTIYAATGTDGGEANSQAMSKGREYASGVVRSYDHAGIENILRAKAAALERAEDQIMALVLLWMGQDNVEIDPSWVRYPTQFDIRGLSQDLEVAKALSDLSAPVAVMREQMKGMTEKLFPRMSPEELQRINEAIDSWEPAYLAEDELVKAETDEIEAKIAVTEAASKREDALAEHQIAMGERAASQPQEQARIAA